MIDVPCKARPIVTYRLREPTSTVRARVSLGALLDIVSQLKQANQNNEASSTKSYTPKEVWVHDMSQLPRASARLTTTRTNADAS